VRINDTTVVAERGRIQVQWSAGVPSITMGTGTHLSTTDLGSGVYRIAFLTTSITAANTNNLGVFPAYNLASSLALTGNTYMGDVLTWNAATDQLVTDSGAMAALPAGTDADDRDGWCAQTAYVTDADATARYWRVNISDTTNPDTYVEIGRLIIAGGIQPSVNASYGAQLGWVTSSTRIESDGGAYIHGDRPRRREVRMLLENQSQAEAFGDLWLMHQRAGTTEQVFFVMDPDDTATYAWRRSFLGVLRELSPVEFARATYHATPVAITEEL
jgi:hypothetical protein